MAARYINIQNFQPATYYKCVPNKVVRLNNGAFQKFLVVYLNDVLKLSSPR